MSIELYLQVREKESRLYPDEIVAKLPSFSKNHSLSNEWQARSVSTKRLIQYLLQKSDSLKILDLGCGNGWLSNQLCKTGHTVLGIDQNLFELKQAARVFLPNLKMHFLETDIFDAPLSIGSFDIILLASSVQYFPNLSQLLNTLFRYLKTQGEIHIIDSAFYAEGQIEDAIRRSEEYYSSLGFPEMSKNYFHHRIEDLEKFSAKWLYRPNSFFLRLKRIFGKVDSPFPWVMIKNQ